MNAAIRPDMESGRESGGMTGALLGLMAGLVLIALGAFLWVGIERTTAPGQAITQLSGSQDRPVAPGGRWPGESRGG